MRKNKIIVIILILISIIQSIILHTINKYDYNIKNVESHKEQEHINEYLSISNINEKIKDLSNVQFIDGKKQSNGNWIVQLKIDGKKEEILESLYKLRNYAIKNYKIEHNKDKSSLTIELNN